tara:strand:+ start:1444 stop:1665 length:222 start_codon:yes stop_codon:yes gene_type:complete
MALDKIKLAHSPLTGRLMMYRHGKDERVALEKRDAEKDIMCALVDYMMDGTPKGAKKKVCIDGHWYQITVKPD